MGGKEGHCSKTGTVPRNQVQLGAMHPLEDEFHTICSTVYWSLTFLKKESIGKIYNFLALGLHWPMLPNTAQHRWCE